MFCLQFLTENAQLYRANRFLGLLWVAVALSLIGLIFCISALGVSSRYTEQFCYLHGPTCNCTSLTPIDGPQRCREFTFKFETQTTKDQVFTATKFEICPRQEGFRCRTLSDPGAPDGLLVVSPSQETQGVLAFFGAVFIILCGLILIPPLILKFVWAVPEALGLGTQA